MRTILHRLAFYAMIPVTLAWDPVTDPRVIQYHLYWQVARGDWTQSRKTVTTATRATVQVPDDQAQDFLVRAVMDGGKESPDSNYVRREAKVPPPPGGECCLTVDQAKRLLGPLYTNRAALQAVITWIETRAAPQHALRKQLATLKTHLETLNNVPPELRQ